MSFCHRSCLWGCVNTISNTNLKCICLTETAKEPQSVLRFILHQAVKKAGIIKPVSLHTLRHSFATHLLEEGLDLFTLKEQMGHTRITTTMTYVHIAQVMPKVAFSPLDRLYSKH